MNPPPLPGSPREILVTTGNEIAGRAIASYLGIVRGVVVRSTGFSAGFTGSFKAIAGGNIPEFSRVCEEARRSAYDIMLQHAVEVGADAVIAFRYDAAAFLDGCTEVLAYGTAVTLAGASG